MSSTHTLMPIGAMLGCDPEIFVSDAKGKVLPSFAFIPDPGIYLDPAGYARITRDGVQVELQPPAGTCRETQQSWMSNLLTRLRQALPAGATLNFTSNVVIPRTAFLKLDPDARRLGCSPSLNVYGPSLLRINQDTYRRRSAGGHIHLGGLRITTEQNQKDAMGQPVPTEYAVRLVKTLDAVLGNTCVLIDRDPDAATRRRVYGRAGEYRLPSYNRLEYRTLSNFWLRAPYLQSMVYALARQANDIASQSTSALYAPNQWDAFAELWKGLDEKKVQRAINKNDYDLAFENWRVVREFFWMYSKQRSGLCRANLSAFDRYLAHIKTYGFDTVVPKDPMEAWSYHHDDDRFWRGFENWLHGFRSEDFRPAAAPATVN